MHFAGLLNVFLCDRFSAAAHLLLGSMRNCFITNWQLGLIDAFYDFFSD